MQEASLKDKSFKPEFFLSPDKTGAKKKLQKRKEW